MNIITKYILSKYLKNFFIVLVSLELFFVGIDFFQNYKSLPNSANLQLLYILYNSFFTLTLALPLSLVFAWIVTIVLFIKSNEHVAFLSLGVEYKKIISPIVNVSIILLFVLIAMQSTPLAYSYNQKIKILDGEYFTSTRNDIFLKYNEYFVYFEKLFPVEKRAENIHIYKLKNDDIEETIIADKAYFQNDRWYVVDAKVIKKPSSLDWENAKLIVSKEKFLHTLEGFKPKILDNVYYETINPGLSTIDAIYTLMLLSKQNISTNKVRATLYYQTLIIFFIIPLIYVIYSFASINSRFFNIGIFVSGTILFTLVIWGFFFMLHKLTMGGIINPELSLLLPMVVFLIVTIFYYNKKMSFR